MNLEDAREIIKTAKESEEAMIFIKQKVDVYLEGISIINSMCEDIFLQYLTEGTTEYVSETRSVNIPITNLCDDLCPQLDSYVQLHLANLGLSRYTTFNEITVQNISENEQKMKIKLVVKFNKL